jgi:hypothetical protein
MTPLEEDGGFRCMHVRNTSDRTADDHELEGNYVLMGVVLGLKEPENRQARDDECEYQH